MIRPGGNPLLFHKALPKATGGKDGLHSRRISQLLAAAESREEKSSSQSKGSKIHGLSLQMSTETGWEKPLLAIGQKCFVLCLMGTMIPHLPTRFSVQLLQRMS
jgi:hypothetical protein